MAKKKSNITKWSISQVFTFWQQVSQVACLSVRDMPKWRLKPDALNSVHSYSLATHTWEKGTAPFLKGITQKQYSCVRARSSYGDSYYTLTSLTTLVV